MNSGSLTVGRVLRVAAALGILISGIVHLDLYFNQDYRFAGDTPNFGRSMILNAVASGVIAALLVARKEWIVRLLGIGFALSTIAVFAYTHSNHSFMGFSADGFEPSPQAQIALIAQIAAIVLIAATFIPSIDSQDAPLGMPALGAATVVAAIVLVGLTLKWKPDDSSTDTVAPAPTTEAGPATSAAGSDGTAATGAPAAGGNDVTIKQFAFHSADVTVAVGTTVTWTNEDNTKHSVVAADADVSFVSDDLPNGASFEHEFDTAGTFPYICGIHPRMKGTITVTG